jgi:DNA-binding transcriptional LysR family regulator
LQQLVSEEIVVIVPSDHPLAGRGEIRMAELEGEQFIAYREGSRLRELLMGAGEHAGFEPQVMLESNESQRIRRLVARRMGVAILPRSDADGAGAPVAVARLVEPMLHRDITLAWREQRRLPPAAREFLAMAQELFAGVADVQAA